MRQIALHELGHAFLGTTHTDSGLMKSAHSIQERVLQSNREFMDFQLKILQSQSKPN